MVGVCNNSSCLPYSGPTCRQLIARGVNPWSSYPVLFSSPKGATALHGFLNWQTRMVSHDDPPPARRPGDSSRSTDFLTLAPQRQLPHSRRDRRRFDCRDELTDDGVRILSAKRLLSTTAGKPTLLKLHQISSNWKSKAFGSRLARACPTPQATAILFSSSRPEPASYPRWATSG